MNEYSLDFTNDYLSDLKKLKNHHQLLDRLEAKVKEIRGDPHHYKTLRNVMKGKCRVQIDSFVLVFEIVESEKTVVLHRFRYHDEAYE
ncbi:MAG: type II toxin-antitoxin system RelE/ParE family toxin [Deltaproteobacteria bacterium]|nr:type II toxin-antitoxin system RelE/ParE family toxin [Deltaproteobacteria bacterium]